MKLADWLGRIGLDKYADTFAANEIDFDLLPQLTEGDVDRLGLPIGARRRLLSAIEALRAGTAQANPAARAPERAAIGDAGTPSAPSAPSAERRQLTVLFCDLAGSTQLTQRLDPEALKALMGGYQQACRAVVERYEGQVAQYLGDGIMAYFGWPVAHEDDAERALRAGLGLVSAVKSVQAPERLQVRIGVASGPVVVGEGAQDPTASKLAVGETPNLAARLQGLAGLDEMVIAPGTRQLAGGVFRYADLGTQPLKGIVEPVHAWRVDGLSEAQGRFEARGAQLTPLVGREDEVGLLTRRWGQACAGEGNVVLISGEPGIGKSRLTQVLSEHAGQGVHTRLRYQCSPYHVNSAFHPIVEQIGRAAGLRAEDSARARLAKLEASLARAKSAHPHSTQLIATLLGIQTDYPALNYSPQKHKDETIQALSAQASGLARQAPVLMILEDAHWIDPSSLEAFDALIRSIAGQRILLIVTYRPEFQPKWVGQSEVSVLVLSRLNPRYTAQLARQVASSQRLPEPLIEQIGARTDGIPLFVEELTKAILERGADAQVDIPATLKDSLMARLDRLGAAKEIAQIGACIGREFDYRLLSLVTPLSAAQLDAALDKLSEAELLFRRGSPPDAVYTFKHALVQDAAYESLLKSRRVAMHGRIAQAMVDQAGEAEQASRPEAIAHQFTEAGLMEQAAAWWQRAAQAARARQALSEVVACCNRALACLMHLPASAARDRTELGLQRDLGAALNSLSGWGLPDTGRAVLRAEALCDALGVLPELGPVLYGVAIYHLVKGDRRAAATATAKLCAFAESGAADLDARIAALLMSGVVAVKGGELHRGCGDLAAAIALHGLAPREGQLALYGDDFGMLARAWLAWYLPPTGQIERARATLLEAREYAQRYPQPYRQVWAEYADAIWNANYYQGDLAPADGALALARLQGYDFMVTQSAAWRAICVINAGQVREGVHALGQALGMLERFGGCISFSMFWRCLADGCLALGETARAADALLRASACAEEMDERDQDSALWRLRGQLHLAADPPDAAQAAACFDRALAIARTQGHALMELEAALCLARLYVEQGRQADAFELVDPVYRVFQAADDMRPVREARAFLEQLAQS